MLTLTLAPLPPLPCAIPPAAPEFLITKPRRLWVLTACVDRPSMLFMERDSRGTGPVVSTDDADSALLTPSLLVRAK